VRAKLERHAVQPRFVRAASRLSRAAPGSRAARTWRCAADRARGGSQQEREPPQEERASPADDEAFDDFPAASFVRSWNTLADESRQVIGLAAGFFLLPALVSVSCRVAVIDPFLLFLQEEKPELSLGRRQWEEVTSATEAVERRIRYDTRMGRAPPLTEAQLDEKLRAVGLRLEVQQQERSRQAVANTLGDGLGTVLLFCGFWFNRSRLRALRTGLFARFIDLEVSTQAFLLLLVADVTVGYHSSDGWVTFMEVIVSRYNVDGPEDAENLIRLFVAVVPVVIDVTFKCVPAQPGGRQTHTASSALTLASLVGTGVIGASPLLKAIPPAARPGDWVLACRDCFSARGGATRTVPEADPVLQVASEDCTEHANHSGRD
jgi:CemA family